MIDFPSFRLDPVRTISADSIKVCPLGPPSGVLQYMDISYEVKVEWMEVIRIVEWIEVKSK
jgi:hypothetical protein